MSQALAIVYRCIANHLIKKAGLTHKTAKTGGITLIQRFGSALNLFDGLDVDVDILAGESVDVYLMPLVAGSHTFYCSNKLLFIGSHRKRGMEGKLTVISWEQVRHVDE